MLAVNLLDLHVLLPVEGLAVDLLRRRVRVAAVTVRVGAVFLRGRRLFALLVLFRLFLLLRLFLFLLLFVLFLLILLRQLARVPPDLLPVLL